jgi:hypothetical protein
MVELFGAEGQAVCFLVAVRAAFLQFFFAMAVCGVLQGFLGKMGG